MTLRCCDDSSIFQNLMFGIGIKGRVIKMEKKKEGNESGMGTGRRTMLERVFNV